MQDNDIINWNIWIERHPKKEGRSIDDLKAEYKRVVARKRIDLGLAIPDAEKNAISTTGPQVHVQLPVQLPLWAEPLRAVPNELVRSALFNAKNRNKQREYIRTTEILVIGDGEITYTGEELRQDDETVWMQVLHLARLQPLGSAIEFKNIAFLRAINWPTTAYYYERLASCLTRLKATELRLESKRLGKAINVSLIRKYETNRATGNVVIKIEPEIITLFIGDHYTLSEWNQRLSLPSGLATWLHAYYASHSKPYPVKLETIADGAGITFKRKNDRLQSIRNALEKLISVGFLKSYDINNGLVTVERTGSS